MYHAHFYTLYAIMSSDIGVWRLCVWERKTRSTVLMRRERLHPLTKRKGEKGRAKSFPASGKWCTEKLKAKMRSRLSCRVIFSVFVCSFFSILKGRQLKTWLRQILLKYVFIHFSLLGHPPVQYTVRGLCTNCCVHFFFLLVEL